MNSRIVIGISGASGSIYGVRILEALKNTNHETHLVISSAGKITIAHEIKEKLEDIMSLADFYYSEEKIGEKIASGSFKTSGMVIAPCSMKTMSEIASGVTSNLLTRAADVTLKKKKISSYGARISTTSWTSTKYLKTNGDGSNYCSADACFLY